MKGFSRLGELRRELDLSEHDAREDISTLIYKELQEGGGLSEVQELIQDRKDVLVQKSQGLFIVDASRSCSRV